MLQCQRKRDRVYRPDDTWSLRGHRCSYTEVMKSLPVSAPTVAVSTIPEDLLSSMESVEVVVSTVKDDVVVVVGGFVKPAMLIWNRAEFRIDPIVAVITLPDPVHVTLIPLGSICVLNN